MFGQQNTPFGGFGQQQQTNTTPGFGGFGQQQPAAPAFGSPAPAAGGLFGSPPAAAPFGQATTGSTGLFGQPAPAPAFGTAAAAPTGGLFGQPAPAPAFGAAPAAPFGAAPAPFGQPAPAAPFGAPAPAPAGGGLFGQPAPAPAFGFGQPAPAPAGGGLFGQPAPAFGQPAPAPAGGGLFGATSTATTPFGAAPTSTFGAPAPATGLFGQPAPAPAFGAPAPSGGLFGAPAPTAFGAPAATFGAPAPAPATGGLFGSPAPAPGAFGASPFGGGAAGGGTPRTIPFQVTSKTDNNTNINLHSITAMPQYEAKSFEELRFEDYAVGNKGTTSSTPTGAAPAGGAFSFGSTPAPAGGLFGSSTTTQFGAPAPASGGLFGAPAAPFGAPAPSTGLFGAPAAPFGAPAPSSTFGSTFGAPTSGGLFGSTPAPAPFGAAPAGGGLFGSTPAPAPFGAPAPSTGFGFGSTPAPAPGSLFGSTAPAPSLFGAPAPAPTGLFGAPAPSSFGFGSTPAPSTGLFGAPAPSAFGFGAAARPPAVGGFGAAPAPFSFGGAPAPFGAPAPTPSLFGSNPAPAPFGFSQPAAPPAANAVAAAMPFGIPPHAIVAPPPADQALEQSIRALLMTREELEKKEIWSGKDLKSKASTPTSVSETEGLGHPTTPSRFDFGDDAVTAPKIRPRGFPSTASTKRGGIDFATLGRGGSGVSGTNGVQGGLSTNSGAAAASMLPPDPHVRSNILQLVVRPDALNKPRMKIAKASPEKGPHGGGAPGNSLAAPSETLTSPPPDESGRPSFPTDSAAIIPLNRAPEERTSETKNGKDGRSPRQGPGEAYYKKTIGSPPENRLALVPASSSKQTSDRVPTLTKDGYETNPPIEDLASFNDAELAAVPDFYVHRPGFGKVEWEGAVDVRDADLDRIVVIEPKDVSVYHEEEKDGSKPGIGTRLNRPATITYFEVFPKNNPAASDDEKQKFEVRLEKNTRRMGAEFVSYNKGTGEWKIRVPHFSRYAFSEDDGNDDEMEDAPNAVSEPLHEPSRILRRKATPFKPLGNHVRFKQPETTEDVKEDPTLALARIQASVDASAERAWKEVRELEQGRSTQKRVAIVQDSRMMDEVENDFDDISESPLYTSTAPTWEDIQSCQSSPGICLQSLTKRGGKIKSSVFVPGLTMACSVGMAWAPDGSIIRPSPQSNSSVLVKERPLLESEIEVSRRRTALLGSLVKKTTKVNMEGGDCPIHQLPNSVRSGGSASSQDVLIAYIDELSSSGDVESKDASSAFSLIARMLREEKPSKEVLLAWLVDECKDDVSKEIAAAVKAGRPVEAIFAALSGGDVQRAGLQAADLKLFSLAQLIGAGNAGTKDITKMMTRLSSSGVLSKMTDELERLLRAISGDDRREKELHRKGLNKLDWKRRLALRLLFTKSGDPGVVIEEFLNDIVAGVVPQPSPETMKSSITSIQFNLIRTLLNVSKLKLAYVVNPVGYAASKGDACLAFHFASVLSQSKAFSQEFETFEEICVRYSAQLLNEGKWAWAIFVVLCAVPGTPEAVMRRKIATARHLTLRYYDNNADGAAFYRTLLQDDVGIPISWFHEAMAGRALTVVDFCSETLLFDPSSAFSVVENRILPMVFFMGKDEVDAVMHLVKPMAEIQNSLAVAVCEFFKLAEKASRIKSNSSLAGQVDEWMEAHDSVLNVFQSYLSAAPLHRPDDFRFFTEHTKRMTQRAMLHEGITQLRYMKHEMERVRYFAIEAKQGF